MILFFTELNYNFILLAKILWEFTIDKIICL